MDRAEFGRRLFHARAAAGIRTATEAAGRLGIGLSSYAKLERGEVVPGFDRVLDLVEKLGLDPRLLVPEWFRGTVSAATLDDLGIGRSAGAAIGTRPATQRGAVPKRGRGRPRKV